MPILKKKQGILLVISGPAGSGKTTLCERLVGAYSPGLSRVITSTTREPRPGETNGIDYHFFSDAEFVTKMGEGAFYEHAVVHQKRYGVLKSEVQCKLDAGVDLILNVDVQGAAAFRQVATEDLSLGDSLTSLILIPSDIDVIRQRLEGRGTDDMEEINRRLHVAEQEISRWREYDYCIVSGEKEADYEQVEAIYRSEQARVSRLMKKV